MDCNPITVDLNSSAGLEPPGKIKVPMLRCLFADTAHFAYAYFTRLCFIASLIIPNSVAYAPLLRNATVEVHCYQISFASHSEIKKYYV